jgi:CSLREA domain-containing protein
MVAIPAKVLRRRVGAAARRIFVSVSLGAVVAVSASFFAATPADAAPFTVNSTGDASDATPGNGVCETVNGNGVCTLRAAIVEANALGGSDVVTVPSGTINAGASYVITSNVEIAGAGASTVLDGGGASAVIRVDSGTVTIRNLVIEDGDDGSAGGGLRVQGGTVELRDATVRESFAFTGGGGIYVAPDAQLTVRRASIVDNDATGAFGGGLWNQGTTFVYESLVAGNDSNRAGGIRNDETLNLRNVTVSGNTVHSPDAGVGGISQNGFAFLNNVTVTNNTGVGDNPASFRGGGIQTTAGETTVMKNSILWGNHGGIGPDDCVGAFSSDSRYNLIGDTTACTLPAVTTTWKIGVDPLIGALANNGGPTRTHLPAPGSPAVDAGSPVEAGGPAADACEGIDQRGIQRLLCDMGAVERQVPVPGTIVVNTTADGADVLVGDANCRTASMQCSLRAAIQEANRLPGTQTVQVPAGTYNLGIAPAGEGGIDPAAAGDLDLTDDVTIDGAGPASTFVDANDLSRVFEIAPNTGAFVEGVTIRDGTDSSGGGVSVVTASVWLHNVTITSNVSTGGGGGIGTTGINEVVVVTGSTVSFNAAQFGDGGGINADGTTTVQDSTIRNNTASFAGGGLRLSGTSSLQRVTVRNNTTTSGALANGGGISAFGMTLEASTVSANTSAAHGGGVFANGSTIRNSTISGNDAGTEGGGVSTSGALSLTHVTVSDNDAVTNGEGTFTFGAGAAITIRNTILYDPGSGAECSGTAPTSSGHNIARDGTCGLTGTGDMPFTNPVLGVLQNNGGPTFTHLPASNGPAIDNGTDAGLTKDQRGVNRPLGPDFDIGAVEHGPK